MWRERATDACCSTRWRHVIRQHTKHCLTHLIKILLLFSPTSIRPQVEWRIGLRIGFMAHGRRIGGKDQSDCHLIRTLADRMIGQSVSVNMKSYASVINWGGVYSEIGKRKRVSGWVRSRAMGFSEWIGYVLVFVAMNDYRTMLCVEGLYICYERVMGVTKKWLWKILPEVALRFRNP